MVGALPNRFVAVKLKLASGGFAFGEDIIESFLASQRFALALRLVGTCSYSTYVVKLRLSVALRWVRMYKNLLEALLLSFA